MAIATVQSQSTTFKIGWWILFCLSLAVTLGHTVMLFALPGDELLFAGWAALSLIASIVLYIPYRRGERWAWNTIWVMVIPFALVIVFAPQYGFYLVIAALLTLSQLLTRGAFVSKD